ncbi:hypothetical protein [Qipengyuania aquimaris]|uniref:hypothetical protein n=1 Tax=Qipengyuania aquimaris TaxID=255984 RepID=UPI001CD5730C|nr:hypothetical protein [Qipengyuania aquimaris]MCA0902368.1 hypothetical protein [Qipengyuania aquimaris]
MTASILLLLATTALIGGVVFLVMPTRQLFVLAFAYTTVIMGLGHFYLGEERVYWLAPAFAAVVGVHFFLAARLNKSLRVSTDGLHFKLMLFFLAWATFTSVLNVIPQAQAILAIKNYYMMWLLVVPCAYLASSEKNFLNIERFLVLLLLLQVPFVIQQALSTDNWDAIVGTYGGDPETSGNSGTLLVFLAVGVLVAVSWWQQGRLSLWLAGVAIGLAFLIVLPAELKGFFIILPLAMAVLLRRLIFRAPGQSALLMLLVGVGIYGAIGFYDTALGDDSVGRNARIERSFEYFFDSRFADIKTGEVSRGASVAIWYEDGGTSASRLVGYGLGASRLSATLANGEIAQKYAPLAVNSTTIAQLLWDTGIIGLLIYVAMLSAAIIESMKIARRSTSKIIRARADLLASIAFIFLPLLIYNRSLVDGPTIQFLVALTFGMICGLKRQAQVHRDHVTRQDRLVTGPAIALPQPDLRPRRT